jgi:hypothetical protein
MNLPDLELFDGITARIDPNDPEQVQFVKNDVIVARTTVADAIAVVEDELLPFLKEEAVLTSDPL